MYLHPEFSNPGVHAESRPPRVADQPLRIRTTPIAAVSYFPPDYLPDSCHHAGMLHEYLKVPGESINQEKGVIKS